MIWGVRMILLRLCNGERNLFLLDFGLIGNMLMVVFVRWLDLRVLVSVLMLMILLWVLLIRNVFGFIFEILMVLNMFCVFGVFGMCREMMLDCFSSVLRFLIGVILLCCSLLVVLK